MNQNRNIINKIKYEITFYNRYLNKKVKINILLKKYLNDCIQELKDFFHLKNYKKLYFFIISKNKRPKTFNKHVNLDYLIKEIKDYEYIEIIWEL